MDEKQLLYVAYLIIAGIIFVTLLLFIVNSIKVDFFQREYLAREFALLEDGVTSSKGDTQFSYDLNEKLSKKFDVNFKEDCSVITTKEKLDGEDIFYCALSEDIKIKEASKEKIESLIMLKEGDNIQFEKNE